jgi:hypothetical protein
MMIQFHASIRTAVRQALPLTAGVVQILVIRAYDEAVPALSVTAKECPMPRPVDPDALRATALEVVAQMQQFNVTHRAATLSDIEDAVDAALAGFRQDLLTQSVQGQALADFRRAPTRPTCPSCGAVVQAIGQQKRQVVTAGEVVVSVERTRGRCSACGRELFPPG